MKPNQYYFKQYLFQVIDWTHQAEIAACFTQHQKKLWCYYFPFLCFYGRSPVRQLVWGKLAGNDLVLVMIRFNRDGTRHLDLFCPALSAAPQRQQEALDLVNTINGNRRARILWVDEIDRAFFANSAGFEVEDKEQEYIYATEAVRALQGNHYRDLRKKLTRFKREHAWNFRALQKNDGPAALELLRNIEKKQQARGIRVFDFAYSYQAITDFSRFSPPDLTALVLEISGTMVGIAMGGKMHDQLANFFLLKNDHAIPGAAEMLRYHFIETMHSWNIPFVNDASDLAIPGLRQHKMKFRPVGFENVYVVKQL
jgi:hypothetical protein